MRLVATTVVLATLSVIFLVFAGCTPPESSDNSPQRIGRPVLPFAVVCIDDWQVVVLSNNATVLYRHAHDVQEHLISCKEN